MSVLKTGSAVLALVALATAPLALAQENELAWTMERAVKQLDRQGEDFETVLADAEIEWKKKSDGMDKKSKGRIYINEDGDFRLNAEQPDKVTTLLRKRVVYRYKPAESMVEEYSLSRHKARLEPYVRLGFSTTGKDLERDFLVTFIGEQEIVGRRTLGLELTPKDDDMRAVVSRVELWMDEASWMPARQVITEAGGGDTMTLTYTGTARNLDLNPDLFKDDWPKGTETVRK